MPDCVTEGGYSDVGPGTSVTVEDETGRVVGVGTLGEGRLDYGSEAVCVFPFTVVGVPRAAFYTVSVGRRGGLAFSFEDLSSQGWFAGLTLGTD
jgi:hypothetical protein